MNHDDLVDFLKQHFWLDKGTLVHSYQFMSWEGDCEKLRACIEDNILDGTDCEEIDYDSAARDYLKKDEDE